MKSKSHIPYVIIMVIGEFFIILAAGFVGYAIDKNIQNLSLLKLIIFLFLFFGFLSCGIVFRYFAEKLKQDDEIACLKKIFNLLKRKKNK